MLVFFSLVGITTSLASGGITFLIFFGSIGISVFVGFVIHAFASRKRKSIGHKVSLGLIGVGLFLGAGVFGRESFQIEGFWFFVMSGVFGGPVIHYLVAKIGGPVLIGRAWCAWGCWTWTLLDYLPYRKSNGFRTELAWIRNAHFALSLALVLILWFVFGYRHGTEWQTTDGLYWFLIGNAFYFALGIVLAVMFKDNRAFCKYVCPITVFLRTGGRLSILRIAGQTDLCNNCTACDKACPMGIPVSQYVLSNRPVLDSECVLCQNCVASCTKGSVTVALRFDLTGPVLKKQVVSVDPSELGP
jgi:polyferredoxin